MSNKREVAARKDIDWESIKKRIEGAVKRGDITREEADAKYEEIKKRTAGWGERDSKRISREDFAKAASEIRKAISEGKITKEQGKAKLEGLKKRLAQEAR
jgi:polyhydroxyalkanoate synthesis regulator phasin